MSRKKQVVSMHRPDAYDRARAVFAVAHMSNTKWRKVLQAIATADLRLTRSEWKCIDSDRVTLHGIPRLTDIRERRFADGQFLPTEYKWFEWVRFPRTYRPDSRSAYEVVQDIEGLRQVLDACGRLCLQVGENGLTLYAYGR